MFEKPEKPGLFFNCLFECAYKFNYYDDEDTFCALTQKPKYVFQIIKQTKF